MHRFLPVTEGATWDVLGERVTCKTAGEHSGGAWSLLEFASVRGCGAPSHRHPWDEAYYLLEGEIAFTVEGRSIALTPGSYLQVPAGTVHGSQVTSDRARYLMVAAPGGVERFLEEIAREIRTSPPDMEKVLAIAAKHKVEAIAGC